MAHLPENAIHELYLRTSSASKKNAPLKLYANLSGKLTAEMKEIGDELRDKIRESTQGAAAQKSSRATVFMPTPDPQPSSKKRKEHSSSNMFHKPLKSVPKVVKAPIPSSTPPPTQKNLTSPATMAPQSSGVPFRRRFIQCLARGEKQEDDLFKLLRITDRNSNLRSEMLNLLDEVNAIVYICTHIEHLFSLLIPALKSRIKFTLSSPWHGRRFDPLNTLGFPNKKEYKWLELAVQL